MPLTLSHQSPIKEGAEASASSCYHCGEDCPEQPVVFQEKNFCCEGCRMVFDILQVNDLGQFYQIEERPGTSLKGMKKEKYEWLESEEVAFQLLDYRDEKIAKVTFELPQIHCASCVWLLENLYRLNDGILGSKVNFLKKEAYLTFDVKTLTLKQVVELLALIGYAPSIDLGSLSKDETAAPKDRTFNYQLGVAGFAFGNIMLLSFPEYLGLDDLSFQRWFGYLNVLLALPVVAYSGRDYLRSAWTGIRQRHFNIDVPIALGMLTLFGRSLFEIFTHTGAGYLDSLAGLVFFLLVGKWFQQRTYHRLSFERDYRSYFPIAATLLKNGVEKSVTLDELKEGNHILVKNEELIPSDGILMNGEGRIDYSFVTGESEPVRKASGDHLFAGGRQKGGPIEIALTKKVSQSYLTQLWNDEAFAKETSSHASRLADKVGRYFTFAILAVAFSTLFYWLPKDSSTAINAFTAVLIIACPCAVALSIPFTLGNVVRLFAKQKFFVKNTQAIEDLAEVDTIVFDKTGTITEAEKSVFNFEGNPLSDAEKKMVAALTTFSSHPVSRGIFAWTKEGSQNNGDTEQLTKIIDFKEHIGQGTEGWYDNSFIELKKSPNGTALTINGKHKGIFIQQNHWRKGLERLLHSWEKRFELHLLSGDNDRERERLSAFFSAGNLHFDQSPQNKLDFIKGLQAKGQKVLMLGDGLNDAGALRQSDIGLVVTDNTNNFTPASDGILEAGKFSQLPRFQQFARKGVRVVYAAYLLALVYNVIGLSYAVQGELSPVIAAILMPLSSITIVAFGVGVSSMLSPKKS